MFILLHKSRCELCLETQYVIAYLADFIICCLNECYAAKNWKRSFFSIGTGHAKFDKHYSGETKLMTKLAKINTPLSNQHR